MRVVLSLLFCLCVAVAVEAPASARSASFASFGEASPERSDAAREGGQTSPITAIRAGRLLDPEAGRMLENQVIIVEGTRIREVGSTATR